MGVDIPNQQSPALVPPSGARHDESKTQSVYRRVTAFLNKRFFLVGAVVVLSAARLAPGFGATGGLLRPELTVNKAGEKGYSAVE